MTSRRIGGQCYSKIRPLEVFDILHDKLTHGEGQPASRSCFSQLPRSTGSAVNENLTMEDFEAIAENVRETLSIRFTWMDPAEMEKIIQKHKKRRLIEYGLIP